MATQNQLDMLLDFEAAASAIDQEGIPPDKVTINLLCERAGYIPQDLRPVAEAMRRDKDTANLSRIRKVFLRAKKMPSFLESVVEEPETISGPPLTLRPTLPPTGGERKAQNEGLPHRIESQTGESKFSTIIAVIEDVIMPLSRTTRTKVLSAISALYVE